ncbi:MAG: Hsp20/alpha crystallin family protein [Deltaproteobacteria bacterium]|nr:Hsp20/alpha crystallin family protein [Deltaproteobacteria bacterium]
MDIKYMSPWKKRGNIPVRPAVESRSLETFHRAINQLFDDFFSGFDRSPFGTLEDISEFSPSLNMSEDEKNVTVTTELPGMDENDININISKDTLTIKGEKKEEKEEKDKESYYRERSFGSFQRVLSLPGGIDVNKTEASFKKGVLTITMPKLEEEKKATKKIKIKNE